MRLSHNGKGGHGPPYASQKHRALHSNNNPRLLVLKKVQNFSVNSAPFAALKDSNRPV
jgi:hypothetical protein